MQQVWSNKERVYMLRPWGSPIRIRETQIDMENAM